MEDQVRGVTWEAFSAYLEQISECRTLCCHTPPWEGACSFCTWQVPNSSTKLSNPFLRQRACVKLVKACRREKRRRAKVLRPGPVAFPPALPAYTQAIQCHLANPAAAEIDLPINAGAEKRCTFWGQSSAFQNPCSQLSHCRISGHILLSQSTKLCQNPLCLCPPLKRKGALPEICPTVALTPSRVSAPVLCSLSGCGVRRPLLCQLPLPLCVRALPFPCQSCRGAAGGRPG